MGSKLKLVKDDDRFDETSVMPLAVRILKGPEPDYFVKSLRVLTWSLVAAIIVSLGVLGVKVRDFAKGVEEDKKALFMKANREAKILAAVDCLNRLGRRLGQSTHGLLLSAELSDYKYTHVVKQCIPEDVLADVASVTWQDNMDGRNLNNVDAEQIESY